MSMVYFTNKYVCHFQRMQILKQYTIIPIDYSNKGDGYTQKFTAT